MELIKAGVKEGEIVFVKQTESTTTMARIKLDIANRQARIDHETAKIAELNKLIADAIKVGVKEAL